MLGLGDRNLHNILVCGETATMANIDFSYLLGYDPKNIESTEMKITHGMVDMLGGYGSEDFETLKFTCSSTYTSIRRHTYFWYALFRYLAAAEPPIYPHSGDLKKIQEHINLRLMPNATEEEVKVAIVKSVNSNSDSWKSSISDYAHSMKTNLTGLFNMEL
jgi:phosphatidylinositol kinase/protein kinase (PI-3  family)